MPSARPSVTRRRRLDRRLRALARRARRRDPRRRSRRYNEEDCLSTWMLRDWLLERQAEAQAACGTRDRRGASRLSCARSSPRTAEELAEREALREVLLARDDETARAGWWRSCSTTTGARRSRSGGRSSQRLEMTSSELVEDAEALGGLEWDGQEPEAEQEVAHLHARVPAQEHKLDRRRRGRRPGDGQERGDDRRARRRRRSAASCGAGRSARRQPLPRALIPGGAWNTKYQRAALRRLGRSVRDGDGRYAALEGVLRREPPLGGDARAGRAELDEMKAARRSRRGAATSSSRGRRAPARRRPARA